MKLLQAQSCAGFSTLQGRELRAAWLISQVSEQKGVGFFPIIGGFFIF